MTIKEAIEYAETQVSKVYEHVPGGYGHKTYDRGRNVWWMPQCSYSWHQAQILRSEAVARIAAERYCADNGIGQEPVEDYMRESVAEYIIESAHIAEASSTRQRVSMLVQAVKSY